MGKVQLTSTLCLLPGHQMQRLGWHSVALGLEEVVIGAPTPRTTSMNAMCCLNPIKNRPFWILMLLKWTPMCHCDGWGAYVPLHG